ncbi:MAG: hypothetical protein GX981_03410 [Tissierellia bacterium]|nr:hypothetical protein [Tissierellia bacterium]
MKAEINNILEELNSGKISANKAINKIQSINISPNKRIPKTRKIKIHIVDKSEDTNIKIPAIPFWLINFLISLGLGLGSIAARFVDDIDEDLKMILEIIDSKDLKIITNELRKHGPFNMVEIKEGDNTEINIRIL